MTMDHGEVPPELDQISAWLQGDGLPPGARPDEREHHLWQRLLDTEAELRTLRSQQANEMKEMDSYVAHIRLLLQQRECVTAGYERDNEQLQQELLRIRQQQEIQSKELAEMLAQEDLGEMGLSSPSEQVAYLLVERATLLERLEAAERRLESHSLSGSIKDVPIQGSSQTPWKKLFGLRKSAQNKNNITPAHSEELSREQHERRRLERDLEEASSRLEMAHQEIRRLNNELDVSKTNSLDPCESELQETLQELEILKKEVDKLKQCDVIKLQRAKEQSDRLDTDNRSLIERVHILELEKNNLLELLETRNTDQNIVLKADGRQNNNCTELQNNIYGFSTKESDPTHKHCHAVNEDRIVQVRELERQLLRLRKEQEEMEERNEELEALLGEAQNASKEERLRHDGELEGLHRRIKSLEGDLKKQETQEKLLNNGEEIKTTESLLQLHLRDSGPERLALLEARLTEEKDWRKQLELDLSAAQAALKKDKEALQIGERELKKLKLEINSLQTECQQGKTLIKGLTQVKGEKAALEEKLAQTERAHRRLQSELEHLKDSNQSKKDLRYNRVPVDQLQEQANHLTKELSSLQMEHNTLRDEMASERRQAAELQAKLSDTVQKKLVVEGEREKLELELQRLKEQLQHHQEHLCLANEALRNNPKSPPLELGFGPVEKTKEKCLDQSLGMALQQKAEENKHLKQDLQRVQNLFTSAERELRYEREKNVDLKRHNTLLDNEKLKLSAELNQLQTKMIQMEQSLHTQTTGSERHQQKIRELELELACNDANRNTTKGLQEELQAERARVNTADKKVVELQQQLNATQHQLRMVEARASESSRLERDSKDLSDTLSSLKAQQQEDHIKRKLLEQREEELQQQIRSLRLKEATLTRTNVELSHRAQQLDVELNKAQDEIRDDKAACRQLKDDLAASQLECDRMQGELKQVFLQLNTHVRKYNEKQSRQKTRLNQAKQVFLQATAQRDSTIQKLENDLALAASLSQKAKESIHNVMEENEKLLEEKRRLLLKISEAEEMGSNGMRVASTVQHRVNALEAENGRLQAQTLRLSNQVSSLERALRNAQCFNSNENSKKVFCDSALQTSNLSPTSGSYDPWELLEVISRYKSEHVSEGTRELVSTQQPSEQGYLNLVSPLFPPDTTLASRNSCDGP
ncbi:coiled-coil domain-containing protein 30 isoform X2 [Corythoichthys intestinalis]|uniref:coiled-coil domain-containing protein 30 isoform X2 n=1 Tax=Corythoichthys intestinalis TaxID=161448 RepID=UPI0025A67007|nr:coiled-coil domain-containing protein 30 isoform X2 [Corythoichthys intestinalis]XP_057716298.1 coiled-coil domain-containing protein 30 isoform X2 [Corythoichthys intestinalis]